jgi:hypothetical protein
MAGIEPKAYVGSIADRVRVTPQPGDLAQIVQPLLGQPMSLQQIKPTPWLILSCGIKIDMETGEVVIPDGLALTDAARAFWDAVQRISGYQRPGFW